MRRLARSQPEIRSLVSNQNILDRAKEKAKKFV
jgi:hypothetical protein